MNSNNMIGEVTDWRKGLRGAMFAMRAQVPSDPVPHKRGTQQPVFLSQY